MNTENVDSAASKSHGFARPICKSAQQDDTLLMNAVKNAFSKTPVYHKHVADLIGDKILLRNTADHSDHRIATLTVKDNPEGHSVRVDWMDLAPSDSISPGSPMIFSLYLTNDAIKAIDATDWSMVPKELSDVPSIELWFDPRE